jgi:hypothetical protein
VQAVVHEILAGRDLPQPLVIVTMVPRPRSENELRPCWPLDVLNVPVVAPVEPCSEGSWVMAVKILGWAARSRSASPNTWVGVGAVNPVDRIRVPVTTISVRAVADGSAGAVCAWTDPADAIIATALVANNTFKKGDPPRFRPKALILQLPLFR